MASGLPVLVSNRCGCAEELVADGENGFIFDPNDDKALAELMIRIHHSGERIESFRAKSREIVDRFGIDRFGEGLAQAVKLGQTPSRG